MIERTFVMIKPDGVERRLVGETIGRFERRGLRMVGMKMLEVDRKLAEEHYAVHKDKPFFNDLVEFITSGPVVAMVWEGEDAVKLVRAMLGALKPLEAQPGTIRGDFTTNVQQNIAHASDAPETADIEITLWFRDGELISSA